MTFKFWKRDEQIKLLKSMQKLEVKDGDIVVLKCSDRLRPEAYKNISHMLKDTMKGFNLDVHVLILDGSLDIGVLTKKSEATQ